MASNSSADDGFHEIQLNGKQLVFLFMAVTVVSVVIFLCGVLVGRGVGAETQVEASQVAPAGEPLSAESPAAAPAGSLNAPATANERLTYPDALGRRDNEPEPLREPEPSTTPSPRSESDDLPTANPPPSPPRNAPSAPAIPGSAPGSVATEPTGSGYAIQVAALRERAEAEIMVRRLASKGYAAYLLPPAAGTPAMYRVRIGKFEARREAQQVAGRLQKEEKFKPWIVR